MPGLSTRSSPGQCTLHSCAVEELFDAALYDLNAVVPSAAVSLMQGTIWSEFLALASSVLLHKEPPGQSDRPRATVLPLPKLCIRSTRQRVFSRPCIRHSLLSSCSRLSEANQASMSMLQCLVASEHTRLVCKDMSKTRVCIVLQRQAAPVMDRRDRFRLLLRLVRRYLAWASLTSKLQPLRWPAAKYTVSNLLGIPHLSSLEALSTSAKQIYPSGLQATGRCSAKSICCRPTFGLKRLLKVHKAVLQRVLSTVY